MRRWLLKSVNFFYILRLMKTTIKATSFKLDEALSAYIERKIINPVKKLLSGEKYAQSSILDIEIGRTSSHHRKGVVWRAEVNITVPGAFFRSEAKAEDVRSAINEVEDEIVSEIKKYKSKKIDMTKRAARNAKSFLKDNPDARRKITY